MGTPVYGPLLRALEKAPLTDADQAAVALAEAYASEIDQGGDLMKLGPLLLATLVQLGLTPAARRAVLKGKEPTEPKSTPLDDLRQRREARQHTA